jgi:hypothetical protein
MNPVRSIDPAAQPGPDVAGLASVLGTALHAAGLPVGPDRCERLARAMTVMAVSSVADLRACALATLVSDPGQMGTFDRVFGALFGAPSPFAGLPTAAPAYQPAERDGGSPPAAQAQGDPDRWPSGVQVSEGAQATADGDDPAADTAAIRRVASASERLRGRDFTQLSDDELRELVTLMRELTLSVPPRRTRASSCSATSRARWSRTPARC